MLVIFFLGFFLDTFEIIFITVPIAAPVLIRLGVDPIWLGVLIGMNLQTSFLTPPFGFALFYLRGVADSAIKTLDIYRGALPFVGLQIVGIALIWLVPDLATWLPDILFGNDTFTAPMNTGSEMVTQPGFMGDIDQFQDLLGDPATSTAPPIDTFENLLPE